jgi:hypothetical protein
MTKAIVQLTAMIVVTFGWVMYYELLNWLDRRDLRKRIQADEAQTAPTTEGLTHG